MNQVPRRESSMVVGLSALAPRWVQNHYEISSAECRIYRLFSLSGLKSATTGLQVSSDTVVQRPSRIDPTSPVLSS